MSNNGKLKKAKNKPKNEVSVLQKEKNHREKLLALLAESKSLGKKKELDAAAAVAAKAAAAAALAADASARYSRILIEASLDPLVTIGPDGKITDVNLATEKVTGFPRKKLIGTDFADYFTEPDRAREGYRQVFAKTSVCDYPLVIKHKSGRLTDVMYNATVYKNETGEVEGVFAAARDVTDTKKTDARVQEQYSMLEALIESASGPVFLIDKDYGYTIFNKIHAETMKALYGADIELGKNLLGYVTVEEDRTNVKARFDAALKGELTTEETFYGEEELKRLFYEVIYSPIMDDGNVSGVAVFCRDITKRKQGEEEIRRLASIVESSIDAIISKTLDGIITSWNTGAEHIYGYKAEEVVGKNVSLLVQSGHEGELTKILESVRKGMRIENYETVRITKDGQPVIVSLSVSPITDVSGKVIGASTIAHNITAMKEAEEEIRRIGAYNRSLIEASLDPLVTIGQDGKITDVNLATEKVTGFPRKKLIGTDFSNYFTEPDRAREGYRQVFAEGSVSDYPLVIKHKSGQLTDVMYNATVYKNDVGEVEGVFAAARDITERLKNETRIIELNDVLKRRATQLSASNEELQSFAYAVSHDLRTPLRAIDGFSQVLIEDYAVQLDKEAEEYLHRITVACQRMGQLIDDMLRLSRVTRSDMNIRQTDISAIASEVAAQKRSEQPDRKVVVRIEPGLTANADEPLTRIVLENLFDNAWKFTSKQKEAVIEFGCVKNRHETTFCIRDNGVGFNQKYVDKLFNPFQRLHSVGEFPGTGIGLATVKRVVNKHGGHTWAEGQEGKGAAFYFTLG